MAKIIEHNFNRKPGHNRQDLLTGSFGIFMQEQDDRKALLGEMVMQARLFLEQEGMDPCEFILSEPYLREFLFPFHDPAEEEDPEEYTELVYLNCLRGRVIALCQFAFPDEEEVTISYQIYSMDLTEEEHESWKLYNFKTGGWLEDGPDCFDLEQVLDEYGRFCLEVLAADKNSD